MIKGFLWALVVLTLCLYIWGVAWPRMKRKFLLWRIARDISRIADKHEGKLKTDLKEISRQILKQSKNIKL